MIGRSLLFLAMGLVACTGPAGVTSASSTGSTGSGGAGGTSAGTGGGACAPPSFACTNLCATTCNVCWDLCPDKCPSSCGDITILASGQTSPVPLAVDAASVYWGDSVDGTIKALPKAGGVPAALATGLTPVRALVLDDTDVFWIEATPSQSAIRKMPKAGGTPTSLDALADGLHSSLALDAGNVYYLHRLYAGGPVTLSSVPKGGGTPMMLATASPNDMSQDHQLAVDSSYVYWIALNDPNVHRIPTIGGPVETFATGTTPNWITAASGVVAWLDAGDLFKASSAGGPPQLLVKDLGALTLFIDTANVYAVVGSGPIQRVPIAGGPVTTLAKGPWAVTTESTLAVDDSYVYWAVRKTSAKGGLILRTPK